MPRYTSDFKAEVKPSTPPCLKRVLTELLIVSPAGG